MSLTSCLKKAGDLLPPELKSSILARAKALRDGGLTNKQAAIQAVQEVRSRRQQTLEDKLAEAQGVQDGMAVDTAPALSTTRLQREHPFEMSTRAPTAKGKNASTEDPLRDLLISDFSSGLTQPKWLGSVADLVTKYPNYRDAASADDPVKKLDRLVRQMAENLVWLHDQVPADTRQRSKLWYDGAHTLAGKMARAYNLSVPQSAGIMAVLSPQKDWFMNVSLAMRVARTMAMEQGARWTPEMDKTARRIFGKAQYQDDVRAIRGTVLGELGDDLYLQAMWLRTYDEAHNGRAFEIVSPEGQSLGNAITKTGKEAKVAWGSMPTIAKAISIYHDGSIENIATQLGTKHKVRNFYNNILAPNSKNGHVTIDTHAVAAALLRALSGNSVEVKHNFGGVKNAQMGLEGTYALYEEAYKRAAERLGLLPRELQSITWEAIRGMYRPAFKSKATNVAQIDKIWNNFKEGRLSHDAARELARDTAGGIDAPSWLGRDARAYVEDESPADEGDMDGDELSGRGAADDAGAGAGDSGAAEEGLEAARRSPARELSDERGVRGGDGALAVQRGQDQGAGGQRQEDGSLEGLPRQVAVQGRVLRASAWPRAQEIAARYAKDAGLDYAPPSQYVKVDPERARRIAQAYEAMENAPHDPAVRAAYAAMIHETLAQYRAMLDAGLKVEFIDPAQGDPYAASPRLMTDDVRERNHMWVFSTKDGFGSGDAFDPIDSPMLAPTEFEISGRMALVNDIFRAVHDYFGHVKEGVGFRADGEENAWRAHSAMYSPIARRALTTETRGQNSWVNYGPHGDANRNATSAQTIFAPQKAGLLPQWVVDEGSGVTWSPGRTVEVDGERHPDTNSQGQPIYPMTNGVQGIINFWRWFGDSKVVDDKGRPLVVYHGTDQDFSAFDPKAATVNDEGYMGAGIYFDVDPSRASQYALMASDANHVGQANGDDDEFAQDAHVMPLYVSIKNPYRFKPGEKGTEDMTREQVVAWTDRLKAQGYDGVTNAAGKEWVAFSPEQIKSAIGNNGSFDAKDADITRSPARPQFYSQLQRAIDGVPERLATMAAPQWKLWLDANGPKLGVKKDEIEWSGLKDWLAMQGKAKVTREELAAFVRDNGVQVKDVVLDGESGRADSVQVTFDHDSDRWEVWVAGEYAGSYDTQEEAEEEAAATEQKAPPPKYANYTVPGGENYREVLITLPEPEPDFAIDDFIDEMAAKYGREAVYDIDGFTHTVKRNFEKVLSPEDQARLKKIQDDADKRPAPYEHSHWGGHKNVLAHLRVDDRTDADGKRVLFLNEIQSDWGQAARKKGIAVEVPAKVDKLPEGWSFDPQGNELRLLHNGEWKGTRTLQQWDDRAAAERKAVEMYNEMQERAATADKVPNAPFIGDTKAWVSLALKRAIMMAVEGGYDKVAFIRGEQAADLYDLSQRVDKVDYHTFRDQAKNTLEAVKDGEIVISKKAKPEELPDLIGKEAAERLLASPAHSYGVHTLEGDDLKVGGQGMHAFYNQIVPQVANDILKKVGGGKVGEVTLQHPHSTNDNIGFPRAITAVREGQRIQVSDSDGVLGVATTEKQLRELESQADVKPLFKVVDKDTMVQPGFDIAPKMHEDLADGMPLFSPARSGAMDSVRAQKLPFGYQVADLLDSAKKLSWWDKTVGSPYHLAQKYPETFGKVYHAIQDFIAGVSHFANRAMDLAPNILPKLEKLSDVWKSPLSVEDANALKGPVFQGTLTYARDADGNIVKAKDVGSAGVVWTDDELKSMWKLNPKQIELYREFRRATNKSIADMAVTGMLRIAGSDGDGVRNRVLAATRVDEAASILADHLGELAARDPQRANNLQNTARLVGDMRDTARGLMAKGYAPLTRYGDYTVYVTRGAEQVYFGMFESEAEANKMAREFKSDPQYKDAVVTQGTMSKQAHELFKGITPETLALFGESLGLSENANDQQSQVFQEYLKLARSSRSAMKHMIERKGVAGFSEDTARVLAGFIYSNARQASTNLYSNDILKNAAAIPDQQGDLKDQAIKLATYAQSPQPEAQAIRGMMFTQFIGGSVASVASNLTQTAMMTLPDLAEHFGAGKSIGAIADAIKVINKGAGDDKDLEAAMKRAAEDGITDPNETHQLQAMAAGKAALRSGDGTALGNAAAKAQNYKAKFMLAWGKGFGWAETVNRRVAFISAYKLARAAGNKDAYGFAKNIVASSQLTLNKGNNANWARGPVGATLFTFKKFTTGYLESLARKLNSGTPEGYKAFALQLAILFLVAGASGFPFEQDLEAIIDGFAQRVLGKSFSSAAAKKEFFAKIVGEAGADFLEGGLSSLPGFPVDFSGRLGVGHVIPGIGIAQVKRDHTRDVAEVGGAVGTYVTNAITAAGQIAQGDVSGAVQGMLPQAAANAYAAKRMLENGYYEDGKHRKVIDTTPTEALLKGIGFQPKSVHDLQEAAGIQESLIEQNQVKKQELTDLWARGRIDRDPEMVADAKRQLAAWNAANPESKIDISESAINKRVQEANQTKAQRMAKAAPKAIRESVKKALAPAPEEE